MSIFCHQSELSEHSGPAVRRKDYGRRDERNEGDPF